MKRIKSFIYGFRTSIPTLIKHACSALWSRTRTSARSSIAEQERTYFLSRHGFCADCVESGRMCTCSHFTNKPVRLSGMDSISMADRSWMRYRSRLLLNAMKQEWKSLSLMVLNLFWQAAIITTDSWGLILLPLFIASSAFTILWLVNTSIQLSSKTKGERFYNTPPGE